jgi:peptide/nickel transport system ATP-binding protein
VDDVSFSLAAGEVLGLVGESGAGKSLTGAAIIGLLEPPLYIEEGRIFLEGERIDRLPYEALRRIRGKRIGSIFQDPLTSLNPLYTVGRQLVQTVTTHIDVPRAGAKARAVQLLKDVGIPAAQERMDHYPHQFSGGMRQRVVIALALCANPRLIIADEPTSALDVSLQAQILNLMKRLQQEMGLSYLLITHDLAVVHHLATHVGVMYLGRLCEMAASESVFSNPRHPYTKLLLETLPDISMDRRDRAPMAGEVPNPMNPPPGGVFHPRCPLAADVCTREIPRQVMVDDTMIACHAVAGGWDVKK